MIKININYMNVNIEATYESDIIEEYAKWRKKFKSELDYTFRDIGELGLILAPTAPAQPETADTNYQTKPMTEKQKALLRARHIDFDENMNIDEAAKFIKQVLDNQTK